MGIFIAFTLSLWLACVGWSMVVYRYEVKNIKSKDLKYSRWDDYTTLFCFWLKTSIQRSRRDIEKQKETEIMEVEIIDEGIKPIEWDVVEYRKDDRQEVISFEIVRADNNSVS